MAKLGITPAAPIVLISTLVVCATAALLCRAYRRHSLTFLLIAIWFAAGFARLSADLPSENIPQGLYRVTAVVEAEALVRVPPEETRFGVAADYTRLQLRVVSSEPSILAGLRIDAYVSGHTPTLQAGDTIDAIGRLDIRKPVGNPGERWSPRTGSPFLRIDHPEGVHVTPAAGFVALRNRTRAGIADAIVRNLPDKQAAVARTLILGQRADLANDVRDAFRLTGTGHLLAISGMHLGLVAWFAHGVLVRLTRSLRWRMVFICGLVVLYAVVVEPRASVIRASVFAVLAGTSVLNGRPVLTLASWSAAAIAVLVVDPEQLFTPGAQLSFAAILGILVITRFQIIDRLTPEWLGNPEDFEPARLKLFGRAAWHLVLWGVLIWAATAPLAAYHFRWVTAWGALLHVVCFPLVALAMASLLPAIGLELCCSFAFGCWQLASWSLSTLVAVVGFIADTQLLSWRVPSPPGAFLFGLYAMLAGTLLLRGDRSSARERTNSVESKSPNTAVARAWMLTFVTYLSVGIGCSYWPRGETTLRVTTLAVGHGLCTVVQTPGGEVVVYDVGSLASPGRTADRIVDALLAMGVRSIDTLVLSHADQDHFGAVEGVIEAIPVRVVRCHTTLLEAEAWSVRQALTSLAEHEISIVETSAGDSWADAGATFTVVQPRQADNFADDNANSLVIRVEYAGRQILLTGDVEHEGLDRLLSRSTPTVDVLFAPHHGGRESNTEALARWARPKVVVSSSGNATAQRLQAVYSSASVFETSRDGALTVRVAPDGTASIRGAFGACETIP